MSGDQFHLRVTPPFRERLERLAAERKTTLAGAMRSAVMQATAQGGIPDEREVLELLSEAARCGSVPAMRELRAYHRERAGDDGDKLAHFDELAARRRPAN
jgi:hypothetical protein